MSAPPAGSPLHALSGRPSRIVAGALLTLALVQFVIVLPQTSVPRDAVDFPAYYWSGKAVLEGEPERLFGDEFKHFQNLPVVGLLLAPLAALEYEQAWYLLWWVNLACILATLVLLLASIRRDDPPLTPARTMLAALICFSFAPVMHRSLVLGQTTPIMVLLLAVVALLVRRGRPIGAGVVLGLICLIKIPPLLLLPLFAARRRFRLVGAAAGVLAVSVLVSLAVFGVELNAAYVQRVIVNNAGKMMAAFNNQSVAGSWMRVFTEKGLVDWQAEAPPTVVAVLTYVSVALILALVVWRARRLPAARAGGDLFELELGVGVALMLLLFPISWIHYYQFLVVPLVLLPFWWERAGLPWRPVTVSTLIAGSLLAAVIPIRAAPYYRAHETEIWFRVAQCGRTMGALLLLIGLTGLMELYGRRRSASSVTHTVNAPANR